MHRRAHQALDLIRLGDHPHVEAVRLGRARRDRERDLHGPEVTVKVALTVTSGPAAFNGDLVGSASWENPTTGTRQWEATTEKVRNVSPIKINEFRTGTSDNPTNAFIELSNAGATAVDISHWTLTEHPAQQAVLSTVTVPAG